MNYLREINALYDWLETNPLTEHAIVLWYALMHVNNKAGWQREFAVAISVVELKTGMKKKTIERARNELAQKGRITWKSRTGNQSAVYRLVSLLDPQTVSQSVSQVVVQTVVQSDPITKLNENNNNLFSFNNQYEPDPEAVSTKKLLEIRKNMFGF
jgi:hypothetical protein